MKKRNSNYELMRIVSMFFIVLYHTILHGNTINLAINPMVKNILYFLELITIVHVNSFILVTGYFQSKGKFRLSKLFELMVLSFFYKLIIIIGFSYFDIISLSKTEIFKELLPFEIVQNWYLKYFIILYCLSPFINILINKLNKSSYLKLLAVLFIFFSIGPVLTSGLSLENNGYSLYQFIYMYLIGAYLRRYPINKEILFTNLSAFKFKLLLVSVFFGCVILNYCMFKYSNRLLGINNLFDQVINSFNSYNILYNNPLIVIQSLAYFIFFGTFNFTSNIINHISKITFGIYLIHDNNYVRYNIYNWMNIDSELVYSFRYFIYVGIIALIIFVGCFIIDSIRSWICSHIKKCELVIKFEKWLDRFNLCDVE